MGSEERSPYADHDFPSGSDGDRDGDGAAAVDDSDATTISGDSGLSYCLLAVANAWVGLPMDTQTGAFEALFDVTPSATTIDDVIGVTHETGTAVDFADLAVTVRFANGVIAARDGAAYSAIQVPFLAGLTYRVRLAISVPSHTYSAFVTPPSADEQTLGLGFAFRPGQESVPSLSQWGMRGTDLAEACFVGLCVGPSTELCPLEHGRAQKSRCCTSDGWSPWGECLLVSCDGPDWVPSGNACVPRSPTDVVGSPELYSESVFEMDFNQGTNGRYRGNGGAWQEFESWNQAGSGGGWTNAAVSIQTCSAVRTELVNSVVGSGRVLRTWIEEGDHWSSTFTYPRTELLSNAYLWNIPWNSEWRMEMPFYVTGTLDNPTGDSILLFQVHTIDNQYSPALGIYVNQTVLALYVNERPNTDPDTIYPLFALAANHLYLLVLEVKFGRAEDGAYVRLWIDQTQHVNVTGMDIGYFDLGESSAGYWKILSHYDWGNRVIGSRSLYTGPVFKLLRRP